MKSKIKFQERILSLLMNRKGASDSSGRVIDMVIVAILVYSLFGTVYTSYISANLTAGMSASHIALLGVTIIMFIIGIVLIFWRMAKGGR